MVFKGEIWEEAGRETDSLVAGEQEASVMTPGSLLAVLSLSRLKA